MNKRAKDAELLKRRKQVRMRFRALIRMVIFNKSWLQDIEEQKISTNIKKNIAMLVRQERKIGILTMAEKALIRTPVWMRTVEDRKKLVNLMLNLTCFAKFPPKIRARLSTVVKFIYLNPGRTIIKEGCEPVAVYFILTGEVEVTRTIYDPDKKKYEEKLDYISGPGDCIGEIELIERCLREQTCKATNDVELLIVYEEDFDQILRPFMEKQWQEKKIALAAFDYFKDWNLHQIVYACKVGLLKQYEPLETIYYEDKGPLSYVHFVISGQCMILQCLKMKVSEKGKKKSYSLLDIQDGESSLMFSVLTNEEILKKLNKSKTEGRIDGAGGDDESVRSSLDSEEDQNVDEEVAGVYRKARKSDYKKYALMCGVDLSTNVNERKDSIPIYEEAINRLSIKSLNSQQQRRSTTLSTSKQEPSSLTTKLESHFIDVGSLTYGGIFGLGEQLEHRVIMARTTVQCLLIPRFWLLEKDQNPGNIWQRMRFYLDSTIPSRELLFQDFLATRKWQQFKKKLIAQTLDTTTKVGNPTKVQDIPIICRIVEANDDDDNFK
ncbi:uncharacterized protein LOC129916637 [Episyrphus balteatus]|uniref:uncharacterized protein LOC129916637 n=1 Tax=Episyrphus balteatus TaxID=286459 RepID=UPI00248563C3|nr:uncharacterized protein LOC129916637 [Episyrphus balteatus]